MASQQLGNYSPEDVVMIIANDKFSHTITGMADGTFISYERSVDRATLYVGADLTAARVLRRNKAGTVGLTLHQSAESNDVLSMIAQLDEEAHDNSMLFSVTIKDMLGRSVFFASQAFIGNDPTTTYSTDLETRDWTITVIDVDRHTGGNAKVDPETQATLQSLGYTVEDKWKSN